MSAPDLFAAGTPEAPLAERLRPQHLQEVLGQDHLLAPDRPIGRMVAAGHLRSLILWGPAGTGKTSLARLLARATDHEFQAVSAVFAGVADLRKAFDSARALKARGRPCLLFVDEIHRFHKGQQDALLPVVEDGTVTLVGATTENPSFALNDALLSRCHVLVLNRLAGQELEALLVRAEKLLGRNLPLTAEARQALIAMAEGDGRALLNMAEMLLERGEGAPMDAAALAAALTRRAPTHDRDQDGHYGLISALHKAVRGSDPDAALYWLARMLEAGEDPRYLGRRLARMAVEDIGLADTHGLRVALDGWELYERLGSPEGELGLVQAVLYLACAPKSNAAYVADKAARKLARETARFDPPPHILNAPTRLMRELGRGQGYAYDHDAPDRFSGQNYFPEPWTERPVLYDPTDQGAEAAIAERLARWAHLRRARGDG